MPRTRGPWGDAVPGLFQSGALCRRGRGLLSSTGGPWLQKGLDHRTACVPMQVSQPILQADHSLRGRTCAVLQQLSTWQGPDGGPSLSIHCMGSAGYRLGSMTGNLCSLVDSAHGSSPLESAKRLRCSRHAWNAYCW